MNLNFTIFLGYFLVMLKDIPSKIFKLISKRIGCSFEVKSCDRELYKNVNQWVLSLNKSIFNKNISGRVNWSEHGMEINNSIPCGVYLTKIDKLTYLFVDKKLLTNSYDAVDVINIRIFGMHSIKHIESLKKSLNVISEDELAIYPYNNADKYIRGVKRDLKTIVVKDKDKLIEFVDRWKNNKDFYKNNGLPHKTGILLYGEPGTGKSSVGRAIASYLNYQIHSISLTAFKNKAELLNRISMIPPKSVVLLEDIDCVIGSRKNDKINTNDDLLSIVLNVLDGVLSPNDVIFIATTNHIEKLDKAFIREGRFDFKLNMTNLDYSLAKQMCELYGCKETILEDELFPINPAYLQNKLLSKILN